MCPTIPSNDLELRVDATSNIPSKVNDKHVVWGRLAGEKSPRRVLRAINETPIRAGLPKPFVHPAQRVHGLPVPHGGSSARAQCLPKLSGTALLELADLRNCCFPIPKRVTKTGAPYCATLKRMTATAKMALRDAAVRKMMDLADAEPARALHQ